MVKSAPLPSRLGNVLKLLSRKRKRAVFSDFSHGAVSCENTHDAVRRPRTVRIAPFMGLLPQGGVYELHSADLRIAAGCRKRH